MRRREFITLLGSATAAWPLAARAQQPAGGIKHLGVLMAFGEDDAGLKAYLTGFHQGTYWPKADILIAWANVRCWG